MPVASSMAPDIEARGAHQTADWIEAVLLAHPQTTLSRDGLAVLGAEQLGMESAAMNVGFREMDRRSRILGALYPFSVNNLATRRHAEAIQTPYAALLHLTPHSVYRQLIQTTTVEMETLFEDIASQACAALLGSGGQAVRFGWPSQIGRPREFPAAVEWLADKIGLEVGHGYRPPARKDGGVDVVAWRSFPDRRPGIPLVLAQCTLQEDIVTKSRDVETRVWASWLRMDVDPLTALVVPGTISRPLDWDEISVRTLLLDRLRTSELCGQVPVAGLTEWTRIATTSVAESVESYWS